jgi:hypothetical protein
MDHSPGCPLAGDPDPDDPITPAVHAAAMVYLFEIGAPPLSVVTIKAATEVPDDAPDDEIELITRITIGIGRRSQNKLAAEHAAEVLNTPGAPWGN